MVQPPGKSQESSKRHTLRKLSGETLVPRLKEPILSVNQTPVTRGAERYFREH